MKTTPATEEQLKTLQDFLKDNNFVLEASLLTRTTYPDGVETEKAIIEISVGVVKATKKK